jgi:hypothetical protein
MFPGTVSVSGDGLEPEHLPANPQDHPIFGKGDKCTEIITKKIRHKSLR